jgi:hypothetical protein
MFEPTSTILIPLAILQVPLNRLSYELARSRYLPIFVVIFKPFEPRVHVRSDADKSRKEQIHLKEPL